MWKETLWHNLRYYPSKNQIRIIGVPVTIWTWHKKVQVRSFITWANSVSLYWCCYDTQGKKVTMERTCRWYCINKIAYRTLGQKSPQTWWLETWKGRGENIETWNRLALKIVMADFGIRTLGSSNRELMSWKQSGWWRWVQSKDMSILFKFGFLYQMLISTAHTARGTEGLWQVRDWDGGT